MNSGGFMISWERSEGRSDLDRWNAFIDEYSDTRWGRITPTPGLWQLSCSLSGSSAYFMEVLQIALEQFEVVAYKYESDYRRGHIEVRMTI